MPPFRSQVGSGAGWRFGQACRDEPARRRTLPEREEDIIARVKKGERLTELLNVPEE